MLQHHAHGFILFPHPGGEQNSTALGRWAQEIAPAVREAITRDRVNG